MIPLVSSPGHQQNKDNIDFSMVESDRDVHDCCAPHHFLINKTRAMILRGSAWGAFMNARRSLEKSLSQQVFVTVVGYGK